MKTKFKSTGCRGNYTPVTSPVYICVKASLDFSHYNIYLTLGTQACHFLNREQALNPCVANNTTSTKSVMSFCCCAWGSLFLNLKGVERRYSPVQLQFIFLEYFVTRPLQMRRFSKHDVNTVLTLILSGIEVEKVMPHDSGNVSVFFCKSDARNRLPSGRLSDVKHTYRRAPTQARTNATRTLARARTHTHVRMNEPALQSRYVSFSFLEEYLDFLLIRIVTK